MSPISLLICSFFPRFLACPFSYNGNLTSSPGHARVWACRDKETVLRARTTMGHELLCDIGFWVGSQTPVKTFRGLDESNSYGVCFLPTFLGFSILSVKGFPGQLSAGRRRPRATPPKCMTLRDGGGRAISMWPHQGPRGGGRQVQPGT